MKRSDVILLALYGASNNHAIVGNTRLQKLLFLIEKEAVVRPDQDDFSFVPYKFGPASKAIYDDLELLVNLGLLASSENRGFNFNENQEIDDLSADDLLGDGRSDVRGGTPRGDDFVAADSPTDATVYRLTQKGLDYLSQSNLLGTPAAAKAGQVVKKYSRFELGELLRYVYSKYPDYTTESEIKDQIGSSRYR